MIEFELSEDKKSVVLPQADGYPTERSEGFVTNMSGLAGVSNETSSASSDSDSDSESAHTEEDDESRSGSKSFADRPCSCDEQSSKVNTTYHAKPKNLFRNLPKSVPGRPHAEPQISRRAYI